MKKEVKDRNEIGDFSVLKASQLSTQQETAVNINASVISDNTKNGGDFALFRKVCGSEYDRSWVKQECKHFSAVASHYLKGASSNGNEGREILTKVRKQTGNYERTECKFPIYLRQLFSEKPGII